MSLDERQTAAAMHGLATNVGIPTADRLQCALQALEWYEANAMPWDRPELEGWDIIGMNHYTVQGVRHLFVAMVRDGHAIRAEGPVETEVFNQLVRLAR